MVTKGRSSRSVRFSLSSNLYFNKSYNICLKYFSKFLIFSKINAKNHDFHGVDSFYRENWLLGNFHYYIHNQRVGIRKYGENSRYYNKGSRSIRFSPSCLKKTVQCAATFHVVNFFIEFFENY